MQGRWMNRKRKGVGGGYEKVEGGPVNDVITIKELKYSHTNPVLSTHFRFKYSQPSEQSLSNIFHVWAKVF